MNILIVYPKFTESFWSFTNILNLVSPKSSAPPKESLFISTLLPITWERRLIDLNIEKLRNRDIIWADYIFVNAEEKQITSTVKAIKKCRLFGKKVVACGSLFTEFFDEFENVEHLVLDDIRLTLPLLINDLENEKPNRVYHSNPFFEVRRFNDPYYSLSGFSGQFSQNIQLSHS